MVSAEGRVIVAPVEDAPVGAILQPLEGHGGAHHVVKETLELPSLAAGDAAITRDVETRVAPGLEELDPLGRDLLLLQ